MSAALDALSVKPGDVPQGVAIELGDPACNSIQPLTFYSQPRAFGFAPPTARRGERLTRGGKLVGSVSMFEYPAHQIDVVRSFLEGHLWGDERMPTYRHPEELVVLGNVILILCFDPRDTAGDWYLDYLRRRHHATVANRCPAIFELQAEIADSGPMTLKDQAPVFAKHEEALLNCSMGALLVGELARELQDWPRAEAAFRRAAALDGRGDARRGSSFTVYYGLALAVSMLGRAEESATLFEHALAIARTDGDTRAIGWAEFNLACARAESGRFALAADALRAAIAIDPTHKIRARTDKSFAHARTQPDFKRLLE